MHGQQHHVVPGIVVPQSPDVADVMQEPEEPFSVTVPVKHDGPMFTQELPGVGGTATQYTASTTPQVVVNGSRFRKKATLISTDNPFLVTYQRNNVVPAACAVWPANVPLVYTGQAELSVATASGTAVVSVITEDWSR